MISALFLIGLCQKLGGNRVHAFALGLAALALIWRTSATNTSRCPMISVGIFWASTIGVPNLMVASMVPAKRTGVYLGILNMMIVVPMLIEPVTFRLDLQHVPRRKGSHAIMLAGALLLVSDVAMPWVNPPAGQDESSIVALGAPRKFQSVHDEIIVGSDGTPTSLVAVGHAAGVAQAAEAELVVTPPTTRTRNRQLQPSRVSTRRSTARPRPRRPCRPRRTR